MTAIPFPQSRIACLSGITKNNAPVMDELNKNESLTGTMKKLKYTIRNPQKDHLRTSPAPTGFWIIMIAVACTVSCTSTGAPAIRSVPVEAPFEMPAITIPDFAECPKFPITKFGAKEGDKERTSEAIANAIDKANKTGGGIVEIPGGKWMTGPIHLKSNVNLHLDDDAELIFSEAPEDYLPAVQTSWEGMECYNYSPLIYAFGCTNIAITGEGRLYAKLDIWKSWYARPQPHMNALKRLYTMASTDVPVEERQMVGNEAHLRPQFIQFNRCENVLLEGVSIRNSPFWVIHPFLSKNIVIRNINVYAQGHNNDGVDPEMSQNILIENCIFDQGDDAIAVKSGRNQDAWRLNRPSRNIIVRNCTIKNGHQLMAIGSELSGGIENVLVENCEVDPSNSGLGHLLFIKTNERRGGFVKNIFMCNVTAGTLKYGILGIETDVLYQWKDLVPTYEVRLTPISNIHLEKVKVESAKFLSHIEGQESLPVHRVSLVNVKAEELRGNGCQNENVREFSLTD